MSRRLSPVWFVVAGAIVAVLIAGFYLLGPRPRRVAPTELKPTPTGTVNILIIGKDARAVGPVVNEGRQRNQREGQSHSDIIVVCHINFGVPTVSLVAIPRDLMVEVPGITAAASNTDFTHMEKINHTYAIGGDRLLRKTVTQLLGIPIHRSIAFDFDTFRIAFDILRPFIGVLRVGDVDLTERDQALKFARKRHGLKYDDADRCRNAVSLIRAIVARTWWLGGTRLGDLVARRLLSTVGEDTDLTVDEVHQIVDGLRQAGFSPVRTETAVLVGEGADVTLARYSMTMSCYLPVYREIEKQVAHFLLDKADIQALDFMSQEPYRMPGYVDSSYVVPTGPTDTVAPLPFDTAGMDTQVKSTLLKELTRQKKKAADTMAADSKRRHDAGTPESDSQATPTEPKKK